MAEGAWVRSNGKVYNEDQSAWEEGWGGSNIIEFKSANDFNAFSVVSPGVGTRSWDSTYGFTSTVTSASSTESGWLYLFYNYQLSKPITLVTGLEITVNLSAISDGTTSSMGGPFFQCSTSNNDVICSAGLSDDWSSDNQCSWRFTYFDYDKSSYPIANGTHIFKLIIGESYGYMYIDGSEVGRGGPAPSRSINTIALRISKYTNQPAKLAYINNIYIGPQRN